MTENTEESVVSYTRHDFDIIHASSKWSYNMTYLRSRWYMSEDASFLRGNLTFPGIHYKQRAWKWNKYEGGGDKRERERLQVGLIFFLIYIRTAGAWSREFEKKKLEIFCKRLRSEVKTFLTPIRKESIVYNLGGCQNLSFCYFTSLCRVISLSNKVSNEWPHG